MEDPLKDFYKSKRMFCEVCGDMLTPGEVKTNLLYKPANLKVTCYQCSHRKDQTLFNAMKGGEKHE